MKLGSPLLARAHGITAVRAGARNTDQLAERRSGSGCSRSTRSNRSSVRPVLRRRPEPRSLREVRGVAHGDTARDARARNTLELIVARMERRLRREARAGHDRPLRAGPALDERLIDAAVVEASDREATLDGRARHTAQTARVLAVIRARHDRPLRAVPSLDQGLAQRLRGRAPDRDAQRRAPARHAVEPARRAGHVRARHREPTQPGPALDQGSGRARGSRVLADGEARCRSRRTKLRRAGCRTARASDGSRSTMPRRSTAR